MEHDNQKYDEQVRCVSCGRYLGYASHVESKFCDTCKEEYINYPVPKKIILALLLILVIVIAQGIFSFPEGYAYRKSLHDGKSAFNGKMYASALHSYESLIDDYELETDDYCRIFIAYVRQGEYEKAGNLLDAKIYGKDIESDQLYNQVDVAYNEIIDYYDITEDFANLYTDIMNSDIEEMISKLSSYVKDNDEEYMAQYILSGVYFQDYQFENALESALKAQEIKPTLAMINNMSLAGIYRQLGEYNKSYDLLNANLKLNKEDSGSVSGIARTMLKEKKDAEALEYLLSQSEFIQDDEYYMETLAMVYHSNGDFVNRDILVTKLLEIQDYDSEFLVEYINNESKLY